jgi:hypothetical protein
MRLDKSVLRAEKLAGLLTGIFFDGVDVIAPGIESMVRKPLRILVGEEVGHRALSRNR